MKTGKKSRLRAKLILMIFTVLYIFALGRIQPSLSEQQGLSEYEKYVQSFVNQPPYGNWTYVKKPMFPVYFNQSQISVGSNWTIVSPLAANHTYHVYAYGEWINPESNPSTDYDIFVYNPLGELEGYHTESAGLPEHLGAAVNEPFFTPAYSGNYTFVLRNDPRESMASKQATFMIIENVQTNRWREIYLNGKENELPVFNTSWAFEFTAESKRIEVYVKVPDALDMYEARLYLMANQLAGKGEMLNGVPLAWEPGLYGEIANAYGGYNLESKEHRGIAYASCENYGQDMIINYTSSTKGKSLYHLVFIGETGEGKIDFLIKTEFGQAGLSLLNPPLRTYPNNTTALTFASRTTDLKSAALNYSANKWKNSTLLQMQLTDNRTFTAILPAQPAGTTVSFEARAEDIVENILIYRGNYTVKHASQLNLTLKTKEITIGENITLTGQITPQLENITITIIFTSTNGTFTQSFRIAEAGTFTSSFNPATEGNWLVQATFPGNNVAYPCSSESIRLKVGPPSLLTQYGTFIYVGVGAGAGTTIATAVYIKKRRE